MTSVIGYLGRNKVFIETPLSEGDVLIVGPNTAWLRRPQRSGAGILLDTALFVRKSGDKVRELSIESGTRRIEDVLLELRKRYDLDLTVNGTFIWEEDHAGRTMRQLFRGRRKFVARPCAERS